jgi:hypothetical protein
MALERAEEALDCCDRCLVFDPENKGVQTVRLRAQKLKEDTEKKERDRLDKLQKAKEAKYKLNVAFRVRWSPAVFQPTSLNMISGAKHDFNPE